MESTDHGSVPPSPDRRPFIEEAVARIRDLDLVSHLREQRDAADHQMFLTIAQRDAVRDAHERATASSQAFDRALARVYVDPHDARAIFDGALDANPDISVRVNLRRTMANDPSAFGTVQSVQRPVLGGLLEVNDDTVARMAAPRAAVLGTRAAVLNDQLHQVLGSEGARLVRDHVDGYTEIIKGLDRALNAAKDRRDQLDLQRAALPDEGTLRRAAWQAVRAILPDELARVASALTSPQMALVESLRATHNLSMGRERSVG